MALLKYLERKRSALPDERAYSSTSLTGKDLKLANQAVEQCLRKDSATSVKPKEKRTKYNDYTPEQRAEIGRYAAENGCHTFLPRIEYDLPHYRVRSLGKVSTLMA